MPVGACLGFPCMQGATRKGQPVQLPLAEHNALSVNRAALAPAILPAAGLPPPTEQAAFPGWSYHPGAAGGRRPKSPGNPTAPNAKAVASIRPACRVVHPVTATGAAAVVPLQGMLSESSHKHGPALPQLSRRPGPCWRLRAAGST